MKNIIKIIALLFPISLFAQVKFTKQDLGQAPYNVNGNVLDFTLDANKEPLLLVAPKEVYIGMGVETNTYYINKNTDGKRENIKIAAPVNTMSYFFPYGRIFMDTSENIFLYSAPLKDATDYWSDYAVISKNSEITFFSRFGGSRLESLKSKYPNVSFKEQKQFVRFRTSSETDKGIFGTGINSGYWGGSKQYSLLTTVDQSYFLLPTINYKGSEIKEPIMNARDDKGNIWRLTFQYATIYLSHISNGVVINTIEVCSENRKDANFHIVPTSNGNCFISGGMYNQLFFYNSAKGEIETISKEKIPVASAVVKPIIDFKGRLWICDNSSHKIYVYNPFMKNTDHQINIGEFTQFEIQKMYLNESKSFLLLWVGNTLYEVNISKY